ncbi:MHYT domain-containing protein [Brucella anthropi]|uniref:MHYT domain-containing protein n=1 Tax=Brucella anthropi TaxID=529 RepID=UPI000CFC1177|nr:hypothetical protein CQ057_22605 [Ochrobactrum sp. MYb49]
MSCHGTQPLARGACRFYLYFSRLDRPHPCVPGAELERIAGLGLDFMAAIASGCGVWCTHFIAMLAFDARAYLHDGLTG